MIMNKDSISTAICNMCENIGRCQHEEGYRNILYLTGREGRNPIFNIKIFLECTKYKGPEVRIVVSDAKIT